MVPQLGSPGREFQLCTDALRDLCEHGRTKPESALGNARLAPDISCEVQHRHLAFPKGSHHFEALDGCVSSFQCLEATHWADQLLEFGMVGLEDVVQILYLPVSMPRESSPFVPK